MFACYAISNSQYNFIRQFIDEHEKKRVEETKAREAQQQQQGLKVIAGCTINKFAAYAMGDGINIAGSIECKFTKVNKHLGII